MLYARRETGANGAVRCQTLREHSLAVGSRTGETCRKVGLENVGILGGTVHDAGKSTAAWQAYLMDDGRTKTVEHSLPGAAFFMEEFTGDDAGRLRQMLALALRGHHGGLRDVIGPDGEDCTPDYAAVRLSQETKDAFYAEVMSEENLQRLFEKALAEEGEFNKKLCIAAKGACSDGKTYAAAYHVFRGLSERFLYAALIDADRCDAARWEDGGDGRESPPNWDALAERLRQSVDAMPAEGEISRLRRQIAEKFRAFETEEHGIYRAFVPTGGGKTLSTMALALRMAGRYGKDHIFFIEPYLTILEQNAKDVREKCAAGDDVFEHHSNVLFENDKDGEKLAAYEKRSQRWEAPIIFTSLVQLLEALYGGKSAAARRFCALANSVIVIDEVQAVPLTSQFLFNLGMSFLSEICGCLVILCTATPPSLERLPYPLRPRCDIVPDTAALYKAFCRTEIDTSLAEGRPLEAEEIAEALCEKQEAEGSVLAIMNTKSLARKLCEAVRRRMPESVPVYYLSTCLCAAHRTQKLDEIKRLLAAGKPVVCVTTQLIEAGVDISFPCVFRALAGLDSVLQAAGRCNRHGEEQRKAVYVVKCAGEERALSYLPEIQSGQKAAQRVMSEMNGADLQSPDAIAAYYGHYYASKALEMAFPLSGPLGGSVLELLGANREARRECGKMTGHPIAVDMLAQSFRTAGRAYHPIPEETRGVLAPWGEGALLLEEIRKARDTKTRTQLLRQAQRYTVNLFPFEIQKLDQIKALTVLDQELGALCLDADHYSDDLGVVFNEYGDVDDCIIG